MQKDQNVQNRSLEISNIVGYTHFLYTHSVNS